MNSHSWHGRTITFLAGHPHVERAVYFGSGMAGFALFVLPVIVLAAWLGDEGFVIPMLGPEWMYWPNVAFRTAIAFGPSALAVAIFYGLVSRTVEGPVATMRKGATFG